MRKIYAIVVSLCLILVFTACASDNGTQLYYDYDLSEYITVGDYSVVVDRNSDNYKKLYREFYFDAFGEDFAQVLSVGEVQEGDKVNISYVGTMNGEEFEGGSELDYSLRIGDGMFTVEGFEKGIIGTKLGEEVILDLTLPDDYYSKDLAGKDVTFEIRVNAITRYPEPDNSQALKYGFESYEDFKKQADDFAVSVCVFNNAYDSMEIKAYPEKETEKLVDELYKEYAAKYAEQGFSVEAYVASVDWTMETFNNHLHDSVKYDHRRMPRDLLSYYFLDKFDRKLTLKEFNACSERLKTQYGEERFSKIPDIELERIAVYEKALKMCLEIAEVR